MAGDWLLEDFSFLMLFAFVIGTHTNARGVFGGSDELNARFFKCTFDGQNGTQGLRFR